jgi:hypothetical protein
MVFSISVLLVMFMSVTGASAATYSDLFPSDTSTVVTSVGFIPPFEIGNFYSAALGHKVEETFTNTGLTSVVGLELNLVVIKDTLTSPNLVAWNVFVNDVFVGEWVQRAIDGTGPKLFEFVFPDIISNDGTYTIAMKVRSETSADQYISLGYTSPPFPGQLLLVGCAACPPPVPIPGAVWLLGTGLMALLGLRRRLID